MMPASPVSGYFEPAPTKRCAVVAGQGLSMRPLSPLASVAAQHSPRSRPIPQPNQAVVEIDQGRGSGEAASHRGDAVWWTTVMTSGDVMALFTGRDEG
jgi:hypothetical protein